MQSSTIEEQARPWMPLLYAQTLTGSRVYQGGEEEDKSSVVVTIPSRQAAAGEEVDEGGLVVSKHGAGDL
ncbi:hypothetical protein CKAH01_10227 [Colletotrichum kahawae]|uniref:Uncharacterized protein n=1 Tax=Colletotrichum kahawae TaxID=34407 RepID=A0AAD9XXT6_COLKA|nr:hypothetical protein CKAH01_10227 [Colletotrichum kahawae]